MEAKKKLLNCLLYSKQALFRRFALRLDDKVSIFHRFFKGTSYANHSDLLQKVQDLTKKKKNTRLLIRKHMTILFQIIMQSGIWFFFCGKATYLEEALVAVEGKLLEAQGAGELDAVGRHVIEPYKKQEFVHHNVLIS